MKAARAAHDANHPTVNLAMDAWTRAVDESEEAARALHNATRGRLRDSPEQDLLDSVEGLLSVIDVMQSGADPLDRDADSEDYLIAEARKLVARLKRGA